VRLRALRDSRQSGPAAAAAKVLIDMLIDSGKIDYAVDYIFSDPRHPEINYEGGEGYPPLPQSHSAAPDVVAMSPRMELDPNRVRYGDNYPKYHRIQVYTSEHLQIAQLFGPFVLKLRDRFGRGLSLPAYAQAKHGPVSLFSSQARGYNGVTNHDEYVFPGYVLSAEVEEAYVQLPFKKREYENRIHHVYQKRIVGEVPFVTLKETNGRVVLQATLEAGRILFQRHPSDDSAMVAALDQLERDIADFNRDRGAP
jgi:hypothetical protein